VRQRLSGGGWLDGRREEVERAVGVYYQRVLVRGHGCVGVLEGVGVSGEGPGRNGRSTIRHVLVHSYPRVCVLEGVGVREGEGPVSRLQHPHAIPFHSSVYSACPSSFFRGRTRLAGWLTYMYFVILAGAHARCEDSASWGCIGRASSLFVLKRGSGSGESAAASKARVSASMVAGCAGVGCAAMVSVS
jgi:hypothetical protein